MQECCPKCNTVKSGPSCPVCGLVFARFEEGVFEEGVAPEIVDLWKAVEADWEDRAVHAIFVENALARGEAGYAAACYRWRGDDPVAEAYLELLGGRLVDIMNATGSTRIKRRQLWMVVAAVVVFLLVAGFTALLLLLPDLVK
jgi:hypothetical protein